MNDLTIEKDIFIAAPAARVFRALTCTDEILQYYPLTSVESDWQVGSTVLYRGEADGKPFTDFGVITRLEPRACYQYRYWSNNHGTPRTDDNFVTITYSLQPTNDGTTLLLRQENLPSQDLFDLMNDAVWPWLLGCLKQYLENSL